MTDQLNLRGTGVAIITPFNTTGNLDLNALTKLVNHLALGQVDTLVVLGTTGESVTLSKPDKKTVLAHVSEVNAGRCSLMMGVGGNNTQEVVETLKESNFDGYSSILSVSPYYNKPTQEGIYRHYREIADASPIPVVLYNVPGRTGSNIQAETTLRLARDSKNIVGIKEASGNMEQVMQILRDRPADFAVISGDDALTLPIIACGGDGVISVVANAFPAEFASMVRFALHEDLLPARGLHYSMLEFTRLIFSEGNPAGIKAALKVLGICGDHVRLPLLPASEQLTEAIRKEILNIQQEQPA
jgi:4-hydroxy-tetrahydrodipicolinate synthase